MKQHNKNLTEQQKRVLFDKATEAPFTDKNLDNFSPGTYACANCGAELFKSDSKYESKTPGLIGWPSFDDSIEGALTFEEDTSLGMARTEVLCSTCGGHLGHFFEADDSPNGKHYCINSVCLDFQQKAS